MVDVQNMPELREKADGLLEKMTTEKMSHPMFCAAMLKLLSNMAIWLPGKRLKNCVLRRWVMSFRTRLRPGTDAAGPLIIPIT